MILYAPRLIAGFVTLLCVAPGWSIPAGKDKPRRSSPSEAVQRALDCKITLELMDTPLPNVLRQLGEMAQITIVCDRHVAYGNPDELLVVVKAKDARLRQVLQTIAGQHGMTFGVVGDHIVVGTEEVVNIRQLRQRVNLSCQEQPLSQALHELAVHTGANVVLDPRARRLADEFRVTLNLQDVPLDTAVRLLAELGGLCAVRMGNVLLVTTEDRAEKLKSEAELAPAATPVPEAAPAPAAPQPMVLPPGPAPVRAVPPMPAPRAALPMPLRFWPLRTAVRHCLGQLLDSGLAVLHTRWAD